MFPVRRRSSLFKRPRTNWRPTNGPSGKFKSRRKHRVLERHDDLFDFDEHEFDHDFGHHDFDRHGIIQDTKHSKHFGDVYYDDDHYDAVNEIAQYTDLFPGPLDYDLQEGKDFDASQVDVKKFNDFHEAEHFKPKLPDGHFLGLGNQRYPHEGHLSSITEQNIYRKDVPVRHVSNNNDKITPFLEPAGIKNLKPRDISFIRESARPYLMERQRARGEEALKANLEADFESKRKDHAEAHFHDAHSDLFDFFE